MGKKLTGVQRKALGSDISCIEQVDTTTFVLFENSRESYDEEYKEKFQMTAAEYETAKAKRLQEEEEREAIEHHSNREAISLGVVRMEEYLHVDWAKTS